VPALGAVKVAVTALLVVLVLGLWLKVPFTLGATRVEGDAAGGNAEQVLKLPVVIDWLITNVLLPFAAVTFTQ